MKKLFLISVVTLFSFNNAQAQLPNGSVAPDFTLTDLDGTSHNLYSLLDQGYTVFLDFSAVWCPPCWSYHTSGALEDLYENHGPAGYPNVSANTTNDVMVFMIEGDGNTVANLGGTGGNTQGDWITGTPYPIICTDGTANSTAITSDYQIGYWPTIYMVCPDRIVTETGQSASPYSLVDCLPPAAYNNDVRTFDYAGETLTCEGDLVPEIMIQNYGLSNLTSLTIEVAVNGTVVSTTPWSGNLATYATDNITLPALNGLASNDVITINASGPNGGTDANPANNPTISFNVILATQNTHTDVTVQITTDRYGEETTWDIKDVNGVIIASGGPWTQLAANGTTIQIPVNVSLAANTCHTFTIYDSYGDGINAGYGAGSFTVTDGNGTVLSSGGVFTDEDGASWKTETGITPIYGCMDFIACNYDALANTDDGSCTYVSWPAVDMTVGSWDWSLDDFCLGGFTFFGVFNNDIFYSDGTITGQASDYTWSLCGTSFSMSLNTNPTNDYFTGTYSNGIITGYYYLSGQIASCFTLSPSPGSGCTDPTADNYDPLATVDDGSCIYVNNIPIIWSDDFSDAGNWIIDHDATACSLDWQIGLNSCTGDYPINDILSTSAGNGWAMIDSDAYGGAAGGNEVEDCWLTMANPVDLNGYPDLVLEFETNYRSYNSEQTYIVVGIGDGAGNVTWPDLDPTTNISAMTNVFKPFVYASGDQTTNPELVTVNISPALVGLSPTELADIYIRFHWTGTWGYAWFVDDVSISKTPDNKIRTTDEVIGGYWIDYANYSAAGLNNIIGLDYSVTPLSQIQNHPYTIEAFVKNQGLSQLITVLKYDVTGAGTAYGASSMIVLNSQEDSVFTTPGFSPTALGNYSIDIFAEADSAGAGITIVNSDVVTKNIEVTNYVYGKDLGDSNPGSYILGGPDDQNHFTTRYEMYANEQLYGIRAYIGADSYIGAEVKAIIYEVDTTAADGLIMLAESDNYTIVAQDLGAWVDVPFLSPVSLFNGYAYECGMVGFNHPTDESYIGTSGSSLYNGEHSIFDELGLNAQSAGIPTWYYTTSTPMVRMNFDPSITINYGCTDPFAMNYDPTATIDDGSCWYDMYGCTDPTAVNYNPNATIDDGSCTYQMTPNIINITVVDVTCNSAASGVINVFTDATTTFDYELEVLQSGVWTPFLINQTAPTFPNFTINGLFAGTFQLTIYVTGNIGGTPAATWSNIIISQPAPVMVLGNPTVTDVSCFGGSDGSISLFVIGGTSPYTFNWSNGSTANPAINLSAGTYTCTITDANGCSIIEFFDIYEPPPLIATISSANMSCFGYCDGTATVAPSGGTPGYTYLWSNGQTNNPAFSLCAGVYSVVVTDANGCVVTNSVTLVDPPPIIVTTTSNNVSSSGACDGTVSASVSGGCGLYAYLWDDPLVQQTPTATGLCAGTYCVIVTDCNGCIATSCVTISDPCTLTGMISSNPPTQLGTCDGFAVVVPTSGTAPYTYQWTDILGNIVSNSDLAQGLCNDVYFVSVTDSFGCNYIDTLVLGTIMGCTDPTAINYDPLANTDDGSCTYPVIFGCTDSNALNYDPSASSDDGSCLYCDLSASLFVADNSPGQCNGWFYIDGFSSNPPIQYEMSGVSISNFENALCTGIYTVTLTDAAGCTLDTTITIGNVVLGCTDPTAINYDPLANTDDGSCTYCDTDSYSFNISCDSYTWDGVLYTTSGAYSNIYVNAAGCDSVHTLNLTINYSASSTDLIVSCDTYTWVDGNVYTVSNNTATHMFQTVDGCDSLSTLNLTINNSNTGTSSQSSCDSYNWNGQLYTQSTTDSVVFTNSVGCDSVHTLNLTINYSNTGSSSATACDSYNWNGQIITVSGSYYQTFTNAAGCDSIHTLAVTINYSASSTDTQVHCDLYTWVDGNVYTVSNTTATHMFQTVDGCDSLSTLDLTINNCTILGCTDPTADNYDPTATVDDGSCTYSSNCGADVTGMFVSDIIDDRVVLNWDNMNTYDVNGTQICRLDKLRIKYREVGTATWLWAAMGDPAGYDANGFCNSTQVTSKARYQLDMNTTYEWWMRAWYCSGEASNWVEGPQFTTADECPVVGNLTVLPETNVNNGVSKATFNWDDSNGPYVFCRIKMRVDTISNPVAADWINVGGGSIPYGTYIAIKYGLTPGQSYRGQAKGHCDPTGHPAYNSLTWTPLIFWTQPSLRIEGGTAITNLDIYPNPSRDVFNISFTSESVQDLKVRVLNVVGEKIVSENLQQFVGEYTKQIDLTTNAKGIYFLEIETDYGVINKKLILQ